LILDPKVVNVMCQRRDRAALMTPTNNAPRMASMVLPLFRRGCCGQFSRGPVFACAVALIVVAGQAAAQTGTIKIVLPVPPGGAGDIIARLLVEQVSRAQGQTMVIESRPGAGTTIGTEAVARAAPDGNTLLINAPFLLISPHLRKLNYDPLT